MSPEKREKFLKRLKKLEEQEAEDNFIRALLILEMELGVFIDDKYPLLKLYEQLEEYGKYSEELSKKTSRMGN